MTPKPPSARQLNYLKALANRTGQTFTYPKTSRDASREIQRLKTVRPAAASSSSSSASTSPPSRPPARPTATSPSTSAKSRATAQTVGGRSRCEPTWSLVARILAATGVAVRGGDGENGRYERGLCDRALVDSHWMRSTRG